MVCLCFQCHEACIAIYSSMENKKLSHWVIISVLSMFFCLLIYTLTGEFTSIDLSTSCLIVKGANHIHPLRLQVCTASWRSDEKLPLIFWCHIQETMWSWSFPGCFLEYQLSPSILLFFFWGGEWHHNWTVLWLSLCFNTQHVVSVFVCVWNRSVILNLMLRVQRRRRGIVTHSFESRCRVVLTVIWIAVTLLIAMFVPDMGEVISVIGGISAFFIFIFPGMLTTFTLIYLYVLSYI